MRAERLVILSGGQQGQIVELAGAATIGRSRENSVQLNDIQVSRRHAMIRQTPSGTFLRDLGSGNGTFVGGRQVVESRLADGDVIAIGDTRIRFELIHPAHIESTPPVSGAVFETEEGHAIRAAAASSVYKTFFDTSQRNNVTAAQLRDAQRRLAAVYESAQIISSERDLKQLLERVLDQVFRLVPAHNGAILLKEPGSGRLEKVCIRAEPTDHEMKVSSSIVQRVVERGEAVITDDAATDARFGKGGSIIVQNITSAMCAPFEHQGEILGALYVDARGLARAFTESDLELLVALSLASATAIRNAQYLARVEKSYQDTLIVLANAVEMRDHYTVGHAWRVAQFAMAIAREMGWDEAKIAECRMGGVLHDVGKIAIDGSILCKPDGLDQEEYAMMQVHPERGARLMRDVDFLVPLIPYALYHHERWDGQGYPYGLAGEEIPMEGRIIAVADTYDAMTSNRPYRKGLDPEEAIARIRNMSGAQFDPGCIAALEACLRGGSIDNIRQNYFEQNGHSIACPFCSTYILIPEPAQPDAEIACMVCHRRVRLRCRNGAYYGELIAETEPYRHLPTRPPRHA